MLSSVHVAHVAVEAVAAQGVEHHKVPDVGAAPPEVKVVIGNGRGLFEYLVVPVHVGTEVGIAARAVGFQVGIGIARRFAIVLQALVVEPGVIVGTQKLRQMSGRMKALLRTEVHDQRTVTAPFGSDQQHAIGAPESVDGRCRRIFQERDRLNFVGNQLLVGTLEPIDQYQQVTARPEGADAPAQQRGRIVAGFSAALQHGQARQATKQGVGQVTW